MVYRAIWHRFPSRIAAVTLVAGLTAACTVTPDNASAEDARLEQTTSQSLCTQAGQWVDPKTGEAIASDALLTQVAAPGIVLLGESHESLEDHRWQAQMLAGFHALYPELVVGFEMFPRPVQPALDAWAAGELSEAEFLKQSRWSDVWGYNADLYMPLFDLARQNRLPMVALNVDRSVIRQVGQQGFTALADQGFDTISQPASPSDAYKRSLGEVYLSKIQRGTPGGSWSKKKTDATDDRAAKLEEILASPGFGRFVDAQLTWDRAMAEALFEAQQAHPNALVVGVMGRGHVEFGHGVPHQLRALGASDVTSLLPVTTGEACRDLSTDVADAVFLVDPSDTTGAGPQARAPQRPRLGVIIESSEEGVKILRVVDGSVADAAQLAVGDIITNAAGQAVTTNEALVEIISRQAPGTWLPLSITREDTSLEIVAKFPPAKTVTN